MSAAVTLKRDPRFVGKLDKVINRLHSSGVAVGIMQGAGGYEGSVSLAENAFWQEFGTVDIPARPFMRATMRLHRAAYRQLVRQLLERMLGGHLSEHQAVRILGLRVSHDMQNTINRGMHPANSPITIELKRSSKPLIDTGALKQAITFEVLDRVTAGMHSAGTVLSG